jgi:hypothetical protein
MIVFHVEDCSSTAPVHLLSQPVRSENLFTDEIFSLMFLASERSIPLRHTFRMLFG